MNFQERFKGRTTLMTKSGIEGLFPQTQPAPFHPQLPQERMKFSITPSLSQKPKKEKLNDIQPKEPNHKPTPSNISSKLKTNKKETSPTNNFKNKNLNAKKKKEPNPYLVVNPYQISDSESNNEEEQYFSPPKYYASHPAYEGEAFDEKTVLRNYLNQKKQAENYNITNSPLPYDSPFKNKDIRDYSGSMKVSDSQTKSYKNKVNTETLDTPNKPKETYTKNMIIAKKILIPEMKGLGPNINTEEWKEKKEKMDKMNQFAMNVKLLNSQKLSETKPIKPTIPQIDENSAKARREKAVEFSKMVPKPTLKREASRVTDKNSNNLKTKNANRKKEKNEKNQIESNFDGENELEKLDRMHRKHQEEIEKRALKQI